MPFTKTREVDKSAIALKSDLVSVKSGHIIHCRIGRLPTGEPAAHSDRFVWDNIW